MPKRTRPSHATLLARCGILLLSAGLPVAGCVCEQGKPERALPGRELAWFDFVDRRDASLLELWPVGAGAPKRRKQHLGTSPEGVDLVATTEGRDPFFEWDFETSLRAGLFSVQFRADKPNRLQLFWKNDDCRIYEERCSTTVEFVAGEQTLDFLLDSGRPLNGVRLDLPEVAGEKLAFHRIRVIGGGRLRRGPEPPPDHTRAEPSPDGLLISSKIGDAWLVFATPWLSAERVEAVEAELRVPASATPELYWRGKACPSFDESCKVVLERVPDKPDFWAARLTGVDHWSGKIDAIRIDPSDQAGACLLRRLAFIRAGEKS